ncbi:glycosyltransferase [Flavobacteriaceae bacterium Ap0902]|nr:glycosyltransferase [Flavobacteriaceae bacterium Ap0902]
MDNSIRILILGNYISSKNVYYSEIETFIGLQKKGFHITVAANENSEIRAFFENHHIEYISIEPKKKFDKHFANGIADIITSKSIQILYVRNGKHLRSFLPFIKKRDFKIVTYYGSASLHWHDPFAYLSYLNPKIDKIICNSEYVYQHVRKQLFGRAKNRAVKIYKGYSTKWFSDVKPFNYTLLNIPKDAIKVIMVGRNDKVKDIPTFLKMTACFNNDIHFILAGHHLTQEHLSAYSQIIQQKNIHLLGFRKDVPELIKGANIYVQTSISEGLGRAISEAAVMGKPIVMTDAGGCTELIDENQSGFVAPIKDYIKLAEHIQKLIESPDLRRQMGQNAIHKIKTELSIDKTIEGFYELFKDLS